MKVGMIFKVIGVLLMISGIATMAATLGGWPAFALWMAMVGNNLFISVCMVDSEMHKQGEAERITAGLRNIMDAREQRIQQWVRSFLINRA